MDNEYPSEPQRQIKPRRARTLIVRWWWRSDDPVSDVIRGVVRDINGAPVGAFDDFSGMVELLHRESRRDR